MAELGLVTRNVSESLGDERKWIHYGLTSTDVVDTAQALRLRQANNVIKADLAAYKDVLATLARKYKHTVMMGRPEMRHIWSLENQYQSWLDVEIAVTAGWVAEGHVPAEDLAAIRANAKFDVDRIAEIEETTRHDMVADHQKKALQLNKILHETRNPGLRVF
ncbi:hypothetical protein H7R52_07315 [Weissella confusa]|uniref:Fumarate lyase N-terminal domain-containing protein n=1 Tax=Weissella confusa TaxID=1583 RepID=A0A923NEL1_WEICO|nr:hypothetical protein [Weissella confusa]